MIDTILQHSTILRMVLIAMLTLALLIPTVFINELVSERQARRETVIAEISQNWGGSQVLAGPVLTVPFRLRPEAPSKGSGDAPSPVQYLRILPSKLRVRAEITPEIRHRGIYQAELYRSVIRCDGEFPAVAFDRMGVDPERILWEEAYLTFGISDLKGLKDSIRWTSGGRTYIAEPGVNPSDGIETGITVKPALSAEGLAHVFSIEFLLNGSSDLRVTPVGEITEVTMKAPWLDPGFVGQFMPESYEITSEASEARWKVLNLNRNYPQTWIGSKHNLPESSFGMRLFHPADQYQKTDRVIKYALLFIALTFTAFFLCEVIGKVTLHPIQYGLIGFALVLFYVLLLSFSEHIAFNAAYAIAAAAIIAMTSVYGRWITQSTRIGLLIAGILTGLYCYLFVTLQLQDYALLLGSIGLFIMLAVVMYLTRKVNWFAVGKSSAA